MKQIVWYLVFTEALTMAFPHLCLRMEDEIKQGDIAIRLVRPLSYIGYHYMAFWAKPRCALSFIWRPAARSPGVSSARRRSAPDGRGFSL
ncbi:hypothetical protein PACILC2_27420 [Paenibacillus cisolokensis]|uniref:ABC transmembrane type-1 domain-containing protein n=1 Tax=Paenibacillus cisolokensis TaxID=1658519 RepID=A0ABQ4N895_9BACL|nr:hypothetical protein [Paenibacillus cisolokensis]GIQ64174.1 hypothetical protein PACILC2_27420 [Paenibacillus cisolokensis]